MAGKAEGEFEVVRECLEWPKLREMEQRIEVMSAQMSLGAREQLTPSMVEDVMSRVGGVFDSLASGLERVETKVDKVLAPLVESLSLGHIDTRAHIDRIDAAILELRSPRNTFTSTVSSAIVALDTSIKQVEAKVHCALAPFMESFALAQIDLKAKVDSLEDLNLQVQLRSLEDQLQTLASQKVSMVSPDSVPACLLDTTSTEVDTSRTWRSCHTAISQETMEDLQVGLKPFEQSLIGMGGASAKKSSFLKQVRLGGDGSKAELSPSKSKKAHRASKLSDTEWGDALSVPFVRTIGSRTLERKSGGRSLPYLPPMF
jgi:hypothetical protein